MLREMTIAPKRGAERVVRIPTHKPDVWNRRDVMELVDKAIKLIGLSLSDVRSVTIGGIVRR